MGWFSHLDRKEKGDWVSARRYVAIVGNAGKGRPHKRWNEAVKNDLKKCGLDRGLAKDRVRWKAKIMGKTFGLCEHGQGT